MAGGKAPVVTIEPLVADFIAPEYKTSGAACFDVYLQEDLRIAGKHECVSQYVPLGFKADIPEGYSLRLHMRSSVGRDYPIQLANSEGIIDSDFTGEIKAIVRNLTNAAYYFRKGQRLFQLELVKDTRADIKVGVVTKETARGKESGSTGK